MAYFTKATYIPFSGLAGKKISLCVFNRLKFVGFDIFHPPMPYPCCKQIEVHFDRTPDRVKIITYDSVSTEFKFPQVSPPFKVPPSLTLINLLVLCQP